MAKEESKAKELTDFDGNPLPPAVPVPPAVAAMIADLKTLAVPPSDGDASQISLDIMERILTAETLEDAIGGTTEVEELENIPVAVTLRSWQESDLGELGVFCVLECKEDSGKEHIVTHGGRNIVAIVYRAQKEGRFPMRAKFRSVQTRSGFSTTWLDPLPA